MESKFGLELSDGRRFRFDQPRRHFAQEREKVRLSQELRQLR
jgi:hypothetical protein